MSKSHALSLFRAALSAADPERALATHLQSPELWTELQRYPSIRVVGAGKASALMARAAEQILGNRVKAGWVNVPDGTKFKVKTRRVHLHESGHPIPDQRGVDGAHKIAEIAREVSANPDELLLCVISGGASALMPLPVPGLTLEQKQGITRQLLASGANIHEINTVRKHLSQIKGGHLAQLAHPSKVLSLILSDVIGDDLSVIGSGPTVADPSTCADALALLKRFHVDITPELRTLLRKGVTESPKKLTNATNLIIGSNRQSMDAAAAAALDLGYEPVILSTTIDGETRDIARMHAAIAREAIARGRRNVCFLSGGETTVTLRGKGLGGRNQEFVLAALLALQPQLSSKASKPRVTIFSAGSDGIDGPTDAAGAWANATILAKSQKLGLNPQAFLDQNDSYHYFAQAGSLIKTGPTGTNVMDIRALLIGS